MTNIAMDFSLFLLDVVQVRICILSLELRINNDLLYINTSKKNSAAKVTSAQKQTRPFQKLSNLHFNEILHNME